MKARQSFVTIVLVLILFSLFSCSKQESTEELSVGLIAPLSGPDKDVTEGMVEAAQLAIDRANKDGTVVAGDKQVKLALIVRDNEGEIEKAVAYAHELINQHNVIALTGLPFSKNAIPVAEIAQKNGIPMISTVSTHPATTKDKPDVYRVCFTDTFQGRLLAHFVYNDLKVDTAALLYDTAVIYNKNLADIFSETFTELGGTIVARERYVSGTTNFRPHLERIQAASPKLLFLPNYISDLRLQVAQMREAKMDTILLGSDTMSSPKTEDAVLFENGFFSTHFSAQNPSPMVQEFVARYRESYGGTPCPVAALTYDAVGLLVEGLQQEVGTDSDALRKGLNKITNFTGVSGTMKFSRDGDPIKSGVILHWKDGKSVFYRQIEPR